MTTLVIAGLATGMSAIASDPPAAPTADGAAAAATADGAAESASAEFDPAWRYTFKQPADNWFSADFDDSQWREGPGGFGTAGTPGARIGTRWQTPDIWLRRTVSLPTIPAHPALLVYHDEDLTVYLNGQPVASLEGYVSEFIVVPLDEAGKQALRAGDNLVAAHCHQTTGGQGVDVHVIDADNVPDLPPPPPQTQAYVSQLTTVWGEQVTTENAWQEYPRPAMVRPQWQNLNGQWDYAITPRQTTDRPQQWDGKILVPFCLESQLGGVARLLQPNESLWYRRSLDVKPHSGRTLLHFEAVDYRCDVYVNDTRVGSHQGGNTPFSFDITDALTDGENQLIVRVDDDTEADQLRGKQVLQPHGIFYTRVSGIWQTVWTEQVPDISIADLKIQTDAAQGTIKVTPQLSGTEPGQHTLRLTIRDGDQMVSTLTGAVSSLTVSLDSPKLWTPDSPHLYQLQLEVLDRRNRVIDSVQSYAGVRTVGKARDADGNLRLTLNGQPIFHWGPLDQGWWPDGLLTPPSDAAMRFDIEFLKEAGFNMIRKHIKVEPRRYYYHCDQIGMLVWQDQVSGGISPPWTFLEPDPQDAQWTDENHAQYLYELDQMISLLENHPSIVMWIPFNEAWGQHRTMEVGQWTVERDPTRLVNIASGGNFWPVGDVADLHSYPHPRYPLEDSRFDDYVKVVGEFGGHGWPAEGHLWDPEANNWGYGGLPQNAQEYKDRYVESLKRLSDLKEKGVAAGVYTQTTDVEGEVNGLMSYDRRVIKIPAAELKQLHQPLLTP